MKKIPYHYLLLFGLGIAGCANLDHIHQFASEAAKTSDSDIVSEDYVLSAQRKVDLVSTDDEKKTREARVEKRETLKKRFDIVHATTVAYMNALDALATDSAIADNSEITSAASAAGSSNVLTANEANLVGLVLNTLQKAALDSWRRAELSKLIRENGINFDLLLKDQSTIVSDFTEDLQQEQDDTKLHFSELGLKLNSSDERDEAIGESLLYIQEEKSAEIAKELKTAQDYQKIITQIRAGHTTLVEHVNDLDSDLVKNLISQYSANIKAIYKGMKSL